MTQAYWLASNRLFDGTTMHRGIAIRIEGDYITDWAPATAVRTEPTCRQFDGIVAPGLIDLQVNGGGDILLNTSPTVDGLKAIASAHRKLGCNFIFPTLITDRPEILDQTTQAMISLWAGDGGHGILGLHIEGPHISSDKRGTHNPAFIRPLDERTIVNVRRLRRAGVPLIVTLAPEATLPGQIAELVSMGVVVSIGHSAASDDQLENARAQGAQMGTHLYNGMTGLGGRNPGVAGALLDSDLFVGIIADRHHVCDRMIRIAWRSRPIPGRMILVSDAMPTVGGSSSFNLYGQEIKVSGGKLVNAEGSLAGVHMALPEAIGRVSRILGDDGSEALAAATSVPATAMRLPDYGHLRPGAMGGISLFDITLNWQTNHLSESG